MCVLSVCDFIIAGCEHRENHLPLPQSDVEKFNEMDVDDLFDSVCRNPKGLIRRDLLSRVASVFRAGIVGSDVERACALFIPPALLKVQPSITNVTLNPSDWVLVKGFLQPIQVRVR